MSNKKSITIDVEKYGGKQVAIVDGKIVASGEETLKVLQEAQKKYPNRPQEDIKILAVPQTTSVIYYV